MSRDAGYRDKDCYLRRVRDDKLDSFDEELEMEIDDDRLADIADGIGGDRSMRRGEGGMDRRLQFRELFRLQGELVKLQDWVVSEELKVVVIFEGRDAAG